MAENVQRFEKQHGPIQDHGAADPGMPLHTWGLKASLIQPTVGGGLL